MKFENKFDGFKTIEQYLEYLWWNMHHSDDPNRQTFAVTCYLDESGTHDYSPFTVVAGLLLNKHNFISLGKLWDELLCDMRIKSPIHMKEFGRPHGKLGYLTDAERYFLFINLAGIINSHKVVSIAGTIDQNQYRDILKLNKRKEMSPYGLCFILCAQINHNQAEHMQFHKNIAFLLDEGGDHIGHVLAAHKVMIEWQQTKPFHMGSITFDDDKYIPALQAADIIAWGVLRRLIRKPFDRGFDFIETIINENHVQQPLDDNNLHVLANRLMKYRDQNH